MRGESSRLKSYFFIAVLVVVAFLSYLVVKDFLLALISGFIFAYLLKPIHDFLMKYFGRRVSAFICIVLIALLMFIMLAFFVATLVSQISYFMTPENLNSISSAFDEIGNSSLVKDSAQFIVSKVGEIVFSIINSSFRYIPGFIFSIFVMLFVTYYLLSDWESFKLTLEKVIPFKDKKKILKDFSDMTYKLVYGTFFIAIIDFVVAFIGFKIAGLELALLFAFLVSLAVFIPLFGTALVWAPVSVVMVLQENYFAATVVLITGLIMVIFVDWLLRNYILAKKSRIHPVVLLFGVLGGVKVFGLFGFVIGPFIVGLLINLIKESAKIRKK